MHQEHEHGDFLTNFYACEKHKGKIAHIEDSEKDEDHITEADHQTWEGL